MSTYTYEALADPSSNIRLVDLLPADRYSDDIHIRLVEVSLQSRPWYAAISYTWGAPVPGLDDSWEKESVPICIDGKKLVIRKNLEDALRHLRSPAEKKRYFWIDALSINQSDLDEKGSQVELMERIYAKAEETVVWLGQTLEFIHIAFDKLNQLDEVSRYHRAVGYMTSSDRGAGRTDTVGQSSEILERVESRSNSPDSRAANLTPPGAHGESEEYAEISQDRVLDSTAERRWSTELDEDAGDPHELIRSLNLEEHRALNSPEQGFEIGSEDVVELPPEQYSRARAGELVTRIGADPLLLCGFRDLFSFTWFDRSWVVQEVALTTNISIMCGSLKAPWSSLVTLTDALEGSFDVAGMNGYVHRAAEVLSVLRTSSHRAYDIHDICKDYHYAQADPTNPTNLIKILRKLRTFKTTDARDKIYSALGLGDFSGIMRPDYTASVCEIFTMFARRVIEDQKTFEIWEEAGIHSAMPGLPPWAPDWSDQYQMAKRFMVRSGFSASWDSQRRFRFSETGPPIMFVDGVILDTLSFVGQALHPQPGTGGSTIPETFQLFSANARNMHRIIWQSYANPEEIICQTGTSASGDSNDVLFTDNQMTYLPTGEPLGRAITETFLTDTAIFDLTWAAGLISHGSRLNEFGRDAWDHYRQNSVKCLELMYLVMSARRAFFSDKKFIGVGPIASKKGDVIAVIMGENVPYVLRPQGDDQYQLVGQCYVHGLMDGQAKTMMEELGLVVQEIALV